MDRGVQAIMPYPIPIGEASFRPAPLLNLGGDQFVGFAYLVVAGGSITQYMEAEEVGGAAKRAGAGDDA